jgi:hypothetical protein
VGLRPLSIGGLLDEAFRIYRRHFLTFVTVMGVVVIPMAVLDLKLRLPTAQASAVPPYA